jgi:predicted phosphohydrolase
MNIQNEQKILILHVDPLTEDDEKTLMKGVNFLVWVDDKKYENLSISEIFSRTQAVICDLSNPLARAWYQTNKSKKSQVTQLSVVFVAKKGRHLSYQQMQEIKTSYSADFVIKHLPPVNSFNDISQFLTKVLCDHVISLSVPIKDKLIEFIKSKICS